MGGNSIGKADICVCIIDSIAQKDGTDPLDLPPLHDSIDTDALGDLFATTTGGAERSGRIEFRYAGYQVRVEFDEEPTVTVEGIATPN
ncbi:HalOD1 output domain-containing protein [Natrinema sp. DC36]|uniref:HalOD1 output domain-containing protein n=1 Tax=Natrinema sp. DC36 TaxID=2878680 RepID=UPI001CEFF26C|nr:HalOD1 output domain-containing protein [Natrinema sp. DC36]